MPPRGGRPAGRSGSRPGPSWRRPAGCPGSGVAVRGPSARPPSGGGRRGVVGARPRPRRVAGGGEGGGAVFAERGGVVVGDRALDRLVHPRPAGPARPAVSAVSAVSAGAASRGYRQPGCEPSQLG